MKDKIFLYIDLGILEFLKYGELMRRVLFLMAMMATALFADLRHVGVSDDFIKSGIKIIDIRTKEEWKETGVVDKSVLITFFNETGDSNPKEFLKELNKYVNKDEEFALICRTGNRTVAVSDFLSKQGYKVINLKGGIKKLISQGYKLKRI